MQVELDQANQDLALLAKKVEAIRARKERALKRFVFDKMQLYKFQSEIVSKD